MPGPAPALQSIGPARSGVDLPRVGYKQVNAAQAL
jgi:hypothetical protein